MNSDQRKTPTLKYCDIFLDAVEITLQNIHAESEVLYLQYAIPFLHHEQYKLL